MRIPAVPSTKLISPFVLLLAFAFCPRIHAQNQAQAPQCPNSTASSGTTQNGSSPSISQSAKNVENAAKSLGSIFKKKAPPADSSATAPCPSAAPSDAPGTPNANAPNAAAAPAQPNSDQSAPAAAASPSQGGTAWQPPSDKPAAAAAPAGPFDPAKLPDVVGIHMGTPREDVPGILSKLHPDGSTTPEGPDTVAGLFFRVDGKGVPASGDYIHVEFTLPPGKQRVYYIERYIQYKQAMTYDNYLAAVRQKYGQEIFTDIQGDTKMWLFDEQGRQIPPDKDARQQSPYGCNVNGLSGNMFFLNMVRSYTSREGLPPATFCDSVIVLSIQAGPGPVDRIHTFLGDNALLRREVTAAGEAAKAKAQQQQQQQLKNAQQAKPNL